MAMTLTEEKRFVVLLSVLDCCGQAKKGEVLDNVAKKHYYHLAPRDLQVKDNRPELIWRNELAYIRGWLVKDGFMDYPARDLWTITVKGKKYLGELCSAVASEPNLQKLTGEAVIRS